MEFGRCKMTFDKYKYVLRKHSYPKTLDLEITWNCNLNCFMCPRRKGHGQSIQLGGEEMELKKINHVLRETDGINLVNLIGAGEPMCHTQFFGVLELINSHERSIKFTTNATLLSKKNIERLPENIIDIHISIDSPYKKSFNKIRLGANLSQILDNVKLLQQIRPDISLTFQMILMSSNICHLRDMIDLSNEYNATLRLLHPICFTSELDKYHIHNRGSNPRYGLILGDAKKYASKVGVDFQSRPTKPVERTCTVPYKTTLIALNGDVYPCCWIYENRGDGADNWTEWYRGKKIIVTMFNYYMGNIFKERFKDIWMNENYVNLRNKLLKIRTKGELREKRRDNSLGFDYCNICLFRTRSGC